MRSLFKIKLILLSLLLAYAVAASDPIRIDNISVNNQNPQIAALKENIFCVWQGEIGGVSTIIFREMKNGKWLGEKILSAPDAIEDTDPFITLDEEGNPHIVWSSRDADGFFSVKYSFRENDLWHSQNFPPDIPERNSAFPSIMVENDATFITFQEGYGTEYDIRILTVSPDAVVESFYIAPEGVSYNLYPQPFARPSPRVIWHSLIDGNFALFESNYDYTYHEWSEAEEIENSENLKPDRLPILLSNSEGTLSALWYDEGDLTDRIFIGILDEQAKGSGFIVDDKEVWQNSHPSAVIDEQGNYLVCWRSETTLGSQIFVTKSTQSGFLPSKLASDGEINYYSHPKLAVSLDGVTHIIYSSDAYDGGTGGIYYNSLR